MPFSDPYQDLPDDPGEAFLRLEAHFRASLDEKLEFSNSSDLSASSMIEYINQTVAAATTLNLPLATEWFVPTNLDNAFEEYRLFSMRVVNYKVQFNINKSKFKSRHSVRLSASDKEKICHYIDKITQLVSSCGLNQDKKDVLLKRLTDLRLEVERDRSRFEAFSDFAIGMARLSGGVEREGAEPWWKWVKPIFEILGAAKENENRPKELPAPEEPKRIEPPKFATSKEFDEEIPF